MTTENFVPALLSPKDAAVMTTLSRTMLAIMAGAGVFPKPVHLSERRVAYVRAEVIDWLAARVTARAA